MQDDLKPGAATPAATLEQHIRNPNIAKNEAEWWAHRRIAELENALAASDMSIDILQTRIAALEAENERLWEALRLIIENESADTGYGNSSAKIARAALGDWKPEAGDLGGDDVR